MLVIKDVLEAALSQRQMLGQGWIASLFEGHRTVVRVLSHTSLCSCLPTAPHSLLHAASCQGESGRLRCDRPAVGELREGPEHGGGAGGAQRVRIHAPKAGRWRAACSVFLDLAVHSASLPLPQRRNAAPGPYSPYATYPPLPRTTCVGARARHRRRVIVGASVSTEPKHDVLGATAKTVLYGLLCRRSGHGQQGKGLSSCLCVIANEAALCAPEGTV